MLSLVQRAIRSDVDAFLELMEQNSLAMYKVARGILRSDEDTADAIQETILTCFEKIHTLKQPGYFKTWMIRILINKCYQIRKHSLELCSTEDFPDIPRCDMSLAEFEFKEMLGTIDEKYRLILVLYYVEGFKIPEIADLLEMNINTVKTRLSRGREQLRAEYQDIPSDSNQVITGEFTDFTASNKSAERSQPNEKQHNLHLCQRITAG